MYSNSSSSALHFGHKKESSGKFLNNPRAFLSSLKTEERSKSFPNSYVRLNSLDGECKTYSDSSKMKHSFSADHESMKHKMDLKQPPTESENKWFKDRATHTQSSPIGAFSGLLQKSYDTHSPFSRSSSHHRSFNSKSPVSHPSFPQTQMPFNLTKGQFEQFQYVPTPNLQFCYYQPSPQPVGYENSMPGQLCEVFGGMINNFVDLLYTVSEPKPTPPSISVPNLGSPMSSLNPNAKVFTPPLNPEAKEFTPGKGICTPKRSSDCIQFTRVRSYQTMFPESCLTPSNGTSETEKIITPEFGKVSANGITDLNCVPETKSVYLKASPSEDFSLPKNSVEDDATPLPVGPLSLANIVNPVEHVFKVPETIMPRVSTTVTPENNSPSASNCVTPAPEVDQALMATSARLSTPWIQGGGQKSSQDETDEESIDDDDDFDSDGFDGDDEEDIDDDILCDESSRRKSESSCDENGSVGRPRRQRSLSTCSDESFIEFTASSPSEHPVVNCDTRPSFRLLTSDSVDSDDETDSESNPDDDWDEIDRAGNDEEDFNEQMMKLGFINPLQISSIMSHGSGRCSPSNSKKSGKRMVIDTVTSSPSANDVSEVTSLLPTCLDTHPSKLAQEDVMKRLKAANDTWKRNYSGVPQEPCDAFRKTSFAPPDKWIEIYEDPELAADLRASRTSDAARRKADQERMERLIGPILSEGHREKVWNRLHGK